MKKILMENAVETLRSNLKSADEHNHFFFWKYLEIFCDTESEHYLLNELELLATVLKERGLESMIECIAMFDVLSANRLKELVGE